MEELFAKAELAGSTFNAERGAVQIVDKLVVSFSLSLII